MPKNLFKKSNKVCLKQKYKNYISTRLQIATHMTSLRRDSEYEMQNLLKSLKNLQYFISTKNFDKSSDTEYHKNTGIYLSNKLKYAIQYNQSLINNYDNIDNIDINKIKKKNNNELTIQRNKSQKINLYRLSNTKKYSKKNTQKSIDSIESKNNKIGEEYLTCLEEYQKSNMLNKLKGQILVNEHNKKMSLSKNYEPAIIYRPSHFFKEKTKKINNKQYSLIKSKYMNNKSTKKNNLTLEFNYQSKTNLLKNKSTKTRLRSATTAPGSPSPMSTHSPMHDSTSKIFNSISDIPSSLKKYRPTSASNIFTINKTNYMNKKRRTEMVEKINDNLRDAIEENERIFKCVKNEEIKEAKNLKNKEKDFEFLDKESDLVDIDKINEYFGFSSKNGDSNKEINEEDVITKIKEKGMKNLDELSKKLLYSSFQELKYENFRLNKKIDNNISIYEKTLRDRKFKQDIMDVAKEGLSIEKFIQKTMSEEDKRNRKSEIYYIIKENIKKQQKNNQDIKDLLTKAEVINSINKQKKNLSGNYYIQERLENLIKKQNKIFHIDQ